MVDTDTATVTPLRPKTNAAKDATGALRVKRHRKRKAAPRHATVTAPVTAPAEAICATVVQNENPNEIKADVTVARHASTSGIVVASYLAAVGLAAVSAGCSITGMTSIFVGAFWPVIGMGVALEGASCAPWHGSATTAAGHPGASGRRCAPWWPS